MYTLPTGNLTWPDHVHTALATPITSNLAPSLTKVETDKDLAPFARDVPQVVRDLNANDNSGGAFTNKSLLKYISDERATKWRPRRDVLRVLCEVGQVVA